MGCGCVSLGLHACTTTPITERRQLKLIPESKLNAQAAGLYEKIKEKEKLSDDKNKLIVYPNEYTTTANGISNNPTTFILPNNKCKEKYLIHCS